MTKVNELADLGQAIWYDNIRRALIDSGELQSLLDDGVVGVTSNPSIFEKAIAGSADYDEAIASLAADGKTTEEIYEDLVLEDIRRTADLLRPIYEQTDRLDGYVSLEANPALAHDTEGTVVEARRLFAALDRPNVMIKVPATTEGIPAIGRLIGEGVNVNVTLMFSLSDYEAVADAYIAGLEILAAAGGNLSQIASVASFFISRVDVAVDEALAAINESDLQGKIAIANAKLVYTAFQQIFRGRRWERLVERGARVQRPLWASTSTKNPSYPDTLYVDSLIGPGTVNTLPPATLNAFLDHGTPAVTVTVGLDEATEQLDRLAKLGIDLAEITERLQADGVDAFANSYDSLMSSLAEKRERLQAGETQLQMELGEYESVVDTALEEMRADEIMKRIWRHDHTVWRPEPDEISNRLGWLHTPETMGSNVGRLQALTEAVRAEGYTHVLLLGMGGSSLAPEVFYKTFGQPASDDNEYLELAVLDSTDPGRVLEFLNTLDVSKTLFIVATKSGGTVETLSFFKYFYNQTVDELGAEAAGSHFVAITDPGSKLEDIADRYRFRETFLNDPNIGGRYSVISYFGLLPAALVGVDVPLLLERAQTAVANTQSCNCPVDGDNNGARLGAVMGELAKAGRDKITFVTSPQIGSFGDWAEQLIAESTGKDGKGILPVVGEPVGEPDVYGDDRLFVHLCLDGDESADEAVDALVDAGHPLITIHLRSRYDLGAQFFLWEMATAVAGYRLGIQPFNQPNVEAAKVLARQMVSEYMEKGELPAGDSAPVTVETLREFMDQAEAGDYVALQAYVPPAAETDDLLLELRTRLRRIYQLATTVGYGPRFLHSTGQLHKGDGGNGLFIQFTSDADTDAPIPDEAGQSDSAMSFGVLEMAQALGDRQALLDNKRRVIRFHLGQDVVGGLKTLAAL